MEDAGSTARVTVGFPGAGRGTLGAVTSTPDLDGRLADLAALLAPLPGVLVAFSGGVDSGVLLAAAVRTLGADRVVAATAVSPSLPASERAGGRRFAASLGVRHEQPRTDELSREGYRANAGDRCAFCKTELVDVLTPAGRPARHRRRRHRHQRRRPARRLPARASAPPPSGARWAPLARAGLTKDDVRAAARRWGLPLADKPAAACLASRIAYGVPVSAEGLARVEAAEADLRAALAGAGIAGAQPAGARHGRGRRPGRGRRRRSSATCTPRLLAAVRGFARVELDPRGFRSGSMNELLPDPVRYR